MHKNFRPIIVVSVTNNERHGVVRSTVSMAIVFNESRSSKSLTAIQGEKILSFPGSPLSEILYYILYFWPESSFFWAEAERKDAEVYRPGPLVDSPSSSSGCQHNKRRSLVEGGRRGKEESRGSRQQRGPSPTHNSALENWRNLQSNLWLSTVRQLISRPLCLFFFPPEKVFDGFFVRVF